MLGEGQTNANSNLGSHEGELSWIISLPCELESSHGGVNWNRCTEAQGQQLK